MAIVVEWFKLSAKSMFPLCQASKQRERHVEISFPFDFPVGFCISNYGRIIAVVIATLSSTEASAYDWNN